MSASWLAQKSSRSTGLARAERDHEMSANTAPATPTQRAPVRKNELAGLAEALAPRSAPNVGLDPEGRAEPRAPHQLTALELGRRVANHTVHRHFSLTEVAERATAGVL